MNVTHTQQPFFANKIRAGAGITDHLSRIYDYSVIQTDMRCLRTYYTSIMTKQRFLAILH